MTETEIFASVIKDLEWRKLCKTNPNMADIGERYQALFDEAIAAGVKLQDNAFPAKVNVGDLLDAEWYDELIDEYKSVIKKLVYRRYQT